MTSLNPLSTLLGENGAPRRLTHAEEIALARQVSAGRAARGQLARRPLSPTRRRALQQIVREGRAAREGLILHNLPLVVSVAARFRHSALDTDDLIQEGLLGLLKAAEKYDPARGTRFGTLAVWWIRQSIGRAVTNTGRAIRVPVNRAWKIQQLKRAAAQMAQETGDEPGLDRVAEAAGISPRAAAGLLRDSQTLISLDAPADVDDREALERLGDACALDPEQTVLESGLTRSLEESLARLNEREAEILRLRFGLGGGEARPLRAIAAAWRMSPEGVRQISQRALTHLRALPGVRGLSVYLEE
jgi:RNA polymerase sigma factor (sigma-70 family)